MSKYDALAEIKKATAEYTKVLERVVQTLEKEQQGAQNAAVKVEAKVSATKTKKVSVVEKSDARSNVAAKYYDPINPTVTWTGRGRQPVWVRNYIEGGSSLEGISIPDDVNMQDLQLGKVLPKYQNPLAPKETWSGRGRQPAWVVNLVKSGKTLEDLQVEVAVNSDAEVVKEKIEKPVASKVASAPKAKSGRIKVKEPVIPRDKLVTFKYIHCPICGERFGSIKRHLTQTHGKTPEQVRAEYGLTEEQFPLTSQHSTATRKKRAQEKGFGKWNSKTDAEKEATKAAAMQRKAAGIKVVAPKYASVANPDVTWSGRGRQPLWVQDYISTGGNLDDLLIAN